MRKKQVKKVDNKNKIATLLILFINDPTVLGYFNLS